MSALVRSIGEVVGAGFGACVVRGELSNFSRAASGHCYFNLKDANGGAALRGAMFRRASSLLDFAPADGQLVDVRGRLAVYEPRGELQFIVESMQRGGAGALYEQLVRLRVRLAAEGLFDPERKRALPAYPRRLGVVTSLAGAALHDIVSALARRAPHVEVLIYPSAVQGVDAPAALCAALRIAATRCEVDALIIARGGGSLEDLWAFNDERVARAIAASPVPVISGIGHETDLTLADLAADVRAPTPTAAAELAAPPMQAALEALGALAEAMRRRARYAVDTAAQRLDRAALRLSRPADVLHARSRALDVLVHRIDAAPARAIQSARARIDALLARLQRAALVRRGRAADRVDALGSRLDALDPRRVLARGYARLTDEHGAAITSAAQASIGQGFHAVLLDGALAARVIGVADAAESGAVGAATGTPGSGTLQDLDAIGRAGFAALATTLTGESGMLREALAPDRSPNGSG